MDEQERIKKVSTDVSQETLERGQWDTFMRGQMQREHQFIRCQNPFMKWFWYDTSALADDDYLTIATGLLPNNDVGGWVPLRNGFFAGATVCVCNPTSFAAGTAIKFVMERNGVQNLAEVYVTYEHNLVNPDGDLGGIVRVQLFNTNPSGTPTDGTQNAFQFKAGERINIRAEDDLITGLTWNTNVKGMVFYLYYTFDEPTPEAFSAMKLAGGGLPGGETGVGGGDDEEVIL